MQEQNFSFVAIRNFDRSQFWRWASQVVRPSVFSWVEIGHRKIVPGLGSLFSGRWTRPLTQHRNLRSATKMTVEGMYHCPEGLRIAGVDFVNGGGHLEVLADLLRRFCWRMVSIYRYELALALTRRANAKRNKENFEQMNHHFKWSLRFGLSWLFTALTEFATSKWIKLFLYPDSVNM
jgi:hypothetical protein